MKKVMVFGVFDGVHDGHKVFLKQARECGDYLIAVVTRDEVAELLKGCKPRKEIGLPPTQGFGGHGRIKEIMETGLVNEAVEGDKNLGKWEVIGKYKPDIIALGYDQTELKTALLQFIREQDLEVDVMVMEAHEPERYHSSLLNK